MDNIMNVIFLGASQLLYYCARRMRDYYNGQMIIKVIDVSDSMTQKKKKQQEEFGDTKEYRNRKEIMDFLRSIEDKTYLFSINNPYIISADVCNKRNLIMVNLHHALLPRHPGRNAEAWTIYEQDQYGGITWHFINAGIDTGDIICKKYIKISEDTTSLKLLKQCEQAALESFESFLPLSNLNTIIPVKQGEHRKRPKKVLEKPNEGYISLEWPIDKCNAFLNAFNYGGMDVMGIPRVVLKDKIFMIKKYSLKKQMKYTKESWRYR